MKQNGETLAMLKSFEKLGTPALDCVVYHKGNCVFRYRSGYSDEARHKPVDGTERYNIYSCSKVITCTAVRLPVASVPRATILPVRSPSLAKAPPSL